MHKNLFTAILITLCIVFLPLTTLAQSDGILLQKDLFLNYPITTTDDLPDQVTFNLYDSETATYIFIKGEVLNETIWR
jgi:hypothetical protein